MEGYQIQTELSCFAGGIRLFEARRDFSKEQALVLCFPRSESVDTNIYRNAVQVIEQLRGKDMLLPLLDTEISSSSERKFSFCVSYQWMHSFKPWAEVGRHGLWIMRSTVEILDDLFLSNLSGEFLGKQMIFVDEEKFLIRLGFIGLANVFQAYNAEAKTEQADWRDDVYNLAQCFKDQISESPSDIVRDCLADKKSERPVYRELLRDIKNDVLFRPDYCDEVSLLLHQKNSEYKEKLINHLNLHDCYLSPWKKEEKNGKIQRVCDFQTIGFSGKFINTEGDGHFFVPRCNRQQSVSVPTGEILRAKFTNTEDSVRNDDGVHHHLATLSTKKDKVIQGWRVVPEKEKKFIEETAFNAGYCHVREVDSSVKKFAFLLQDDKMNWQQVENLKQKQKQLEAVPMVVQAHGGHSNVGIVDDITKGRLTIGVELRMDKIPSRGELQINGSSKIPFDFYYLNDKKRVVFVACDIDAESVYVNLSAMLKKRSPIDVTIAGQIGVLGELTEGQIQILPEITTRDAEVGYSDISRSGELQEDIHVEITPFKRQIDAVDQFEQRDIWEPLLCGILATPSEHKPIIVQPTELEWSNKKLDVA